MDRDYRIGIFYTEETLRWLSEAISGGIEEEGLLFSLQGLSDWDENAGPEQFVNQVYEACCLAPLEIAIGVCRDEIFLCHKKLEKTERLFSMKTADMDAEKAKRFGQNAARLIICRPLLEIGI